LLKVDIQMIFYILIKVTINKILNSRRVIVRFCSLFSLTGSQKFLVVEFFAGLCHVLQHLAGSEGDMSGHVNTDLVNERIW